LFKFKANLCKSFSVTPNGKNGEESEINRCLLLIESKLGWGSSDGWVHYDFEKLSDIVNDSTGVRLSTSTLKRIWGKLKYDHAPTLTTLNTLAQFAGYADWRNFRQKDASAADAAAVGTAQPVLRQSVLRQSVLRQPTMAH
jgi:hypothetical protein